MKLGAANLPPPYDSPMDKRMASSAHLTLLRLRTQQVARLLADGLAADLANAGAAPLHLVNIAGGPAIDSMNALILLNARSSRLVAAIDRHPCSRSATRPARFSAPMR